jgi:hypothetical protein
MQGRNHFSEKEANEIRALLSEKSRRVGTAQNSVRAKLRSKFRFYIHDFGEFKGGFSVEDFDTLIKSKKIIIGSANLANETNLASGKTSLAFARVALSDESYIIDLCDAELGQVAIRQNRFDFLVGDAGTRLPVDAYYPALNLVVEYHERQHTEAVPLFDSRPTVSGVLRREQRKLYDQRRRDVLKQYNICLVGLSYSEFAHDSRRRLLRNTLEDTKIIGHKLAPWIVP